MPRGLAIHNLMLSCVQKVSQEVSNEPGLARSCNYLALLVEGLSCIEISERLNLSREHVSRVIRKSTMALIVDVFLTVIENGDQTK